MELICIGGQMQTRVNIHLKSVLKTICAFLFGGLLFHFIVMMINFYTYQKPVNTNTGFGIFNSIFALNMSSMMIAYGFLVSAIFYLIIILKLKMKENHKKELIYKCEHERISTMQLVTAEMIERISKYNNEILEWVEVRNRNGGASQRVEEASRQIAQSLHSLSHLSYVAQYGENASKDINDLEKNLKNAL
jgi:hypothetical protein